MVHIKQSFAQQQRSKSTSTLNKEKRELFKKIQKAKKEKDGQSVLVNKAKLSDINLVLAQRNTKECVEDKKLKKVLG